MRPVRRRRYTEEEFHLLIDEALASLPPDLRERMSNVAIVVENAPSAAQLRRNRVPPGGTLLGLYEGIPLTQRTAHYGNVVPDKITLFQAPIEAAAGYDPERIRRQVRRTVVHELAHHFGIDDDRLEELGAY
ncbi:MAG TPA: metallopeptidase family protein [Anaerolineae bacterium]|nr:metallopeptidase family protein [Anaerolineae bacterium]